MKLRGFLSMMIIGVLAACTTGAMREEIERTVQQVEQDVERAKEPIPPLKSNPLVVTDKVWAGSRAERMRRGLPLPKKFESARGIALVSASPMPLSEIVKTVAGQTGIPMRMTADVQSGMPSSSPQIPRPGAGNPGGGAQDDGASMSVAYEGPLSGLLDQVASHYGINWRYDGGAVTFSRFETRIFMVEAMPGKGKYSDKISGDGGGSSGGGGGGGGSSSSALTQEAELQADLDIWAEIGNTVNAILNGTGTAVLAPSMGTITVSTTLDVMKRVANYIAEQNSRLTRQIAINVTVYTADIENEDDFNNQFDLALKSIKPFSFQGVVAPAFSTASESFSSLSVGIIDNPNVTANTLLTAISKITNNVRVAQFPMTTLNNVPITRRVGRDIAFLASSAVTTSGTVGSTTATLTPGTVREGFAIQLTPRLLADGRLLLQYSLNLTDLVSLVRFDSGGDTPSSIQLPTTSSRVFVQQSLLRSGSTLVLAGFGQDQTNQNANGTLDPYNFLLGGGIGNNKKKTLLLVTIKPQELDVPPLEQP